MVRLPVVPWPNISSSYQLSGVPKKSSTRQKEPYIHTVSRYSTTRQTTFEKLFMGQRNFFGIPDT